ncbi:MAG: PRC-barrel domain-containing protein [Acidimicrobiia bacterium]|nr:PRC-barrel domain-containing protein [Acidimicrobiia bacterium]
MSLDSTPSVTGHDVIDERGTRIGKASDVLFDRHDGHPAWVQVDQGLLKSRHVLIPLERAYRADDAVVVPYTKEMLKRAPRVKSPVALTNELEAELVAFYGLAESA